MRATMTTIRGNRLNQTIVLASPPPIFLVLKRTKVTDSAATQEEAAKREGSVLNGTFLLIKHLLLRLQGGSRIILYRDGRLVAFLIPIFNTVASSTVLLLLLLLLLLLQMVQFVSQMIHQLFHPSFIPRLPICRLLSGDNKLRLISLKLVSQIS